MRTVIRQFTALFLLAALLCHWQISIVAKSEDANLTVTVSFKADEPVAPKTEIEIGLSRALTAAEQIGVLLEKTDVTGLFSAGEKILRYQAELLPLPVGASKMTVYLVKNNNWKEIARFQLTVNSQQTEESEVSKKPDAPVEPEAQNEKTESQPPKSEEQSANPPFGLEKFNFLPSVTLNIKPKTFQLFAFPTPEPIADPAQRPALMDFGLQFSVKNEVKRGAFALESSFDFAGSSKKEEALQFGTLGAEAPQIDLSSYLMQFQIGKAKFAWGHTSFGNNRHLVNSFSSRGLSVNIPINKHFDVTAGFLNGTSIVGFGNFFGLKKFDHQTQGVTFGIELFPKRQNAMRLEVTGFNAYIQPLNSVSEGRIADAERSRGGGLRLVTSDKSERFKLEAGFALSNSFNPQDTTLDPEGIAVPLPAVSRTSYYVETSYQILKDVALVKDRKINLNFTFKHELVEPLYKSLGASAGADKTSQEYGLDASIGDITLQFGHNRSHDNLRKVSTIKKQPLRANRFSIGVPLASIFGKADKPSPFLPRLAYSFDQNKQVDVAILVDGLSQIDPLELTNLRGANQSFSSTWQFNKFNIEYRYNRSFTDNRQTGSETKDLLGQVHGVSVGVNPFNNLNFSFGYNLETSRNFDLKQTNRTRALTFGGTWQAFKGATLAGNFSHTLADDAANTNRNHNTNYDFQFAYNFSIGNSKFKKFGMQAFVRYADTFARTRDLIFDVNNLTKSRVATGGLTFNFF